MKNFAKMILNKAGEVTGRITENSVVENNAVFLACLLVMEAIFLRGHLITDCLLKGWIMGLFYRPIRFFINSLANKCIHWLISKYNVDASKIVSGLLIVIAVVLITQHHVITFLIAFGFTILYRTGKKTESKKASKTSDSNWDMDMSIFE